jgi:hypothetical protein
MSELVTWEVCLRCGRPAAVGWASAGGSGGAPAEDRPVEFDCRAGCQVGLEELARAYRSPGPHTSPGGAAEPGQSLQA